MIWKILINNQNDENKMNGKKRETKTKIYTKKYIIILKLL